jgi:hypothetical protein
MCFALAVGHQLSYAACWPAPGWSGRLVAVSFQDSPPEGSGATGPCAVRLPCLQVTLHGSPSSLAVTLYLSGPYAGTAAGPGGCRWPAEAHGQVLRVQFCI